SAQARATTCAHVSWLVRYSTQCSTDCSIMTWSPHCMCTARSGSRRRRTQAQKLMLDHSNSGVVGQPPALDGVGSGITAHTSPIGVLVTLPRAPLGRRVDFLRHPRP